MLEAEVKTQSGPEAKEIEVFFPDNLKQGFYANNIFITHTTEEFYLDFLSICPPVGSVVSRIILTPSHTKRLIKALSDNLSLYEKKFGEVPSEIKPK